MASFILTGFSSTPRNLAGSDVGYVGPSGELVVTNNQPIFIASGTVTLTILGTVAVLGNNGFSGAVVGQGDTFDMLIGAGGSVSSPGTAIFSLCDVASNVNNAGTVHSQATGILADSLEGGAFTLINSGTVLGDQNAVRGGLGLGTVDIFNTGTLTGVEIGIDLFNTSATSSFYLRNHGTIDGGAFAIRGSGGTDSIINTGTIGNDVTLGTGDDLFRNKSAGFVAGAVDGGAGKDVLSGAAADDVFLGGGGADVLRGRGGDDDLSGGAFTDTLYGGRGEDIIDGGGGADLINAGYGDDTVTGGGGADSFVIIRNAGHDVITDFQNGTDVIDISAFGLRPADYATVVSPALSNAGNGATALDLTALGGSGSLLVEGLAFAQADASDFVL